MGEGGQGCCVGEGGEKQERKKMTRQKLSLFARDKPEKLIEPDSRNDLSSLSAAAAVLTVHLCRASSHVYLYCESYGF